MATQTRYKVVANLRTMDARPYVVYNTKAAALEAFKQLSVEGITQGIPLNPITVDETLVSEGVQLTHWPPAEIRCFVIEELKEVLP